MESFHNIDHTKNFLFMLHYFCKGRSVSIFSIEKVLCKAFFTKWNEDFGGCIMPYHIQRVAVLGAGTMGAAIAAHAANAGLAVDLLDLAPAEATPEETAKGLSPADRAVRDRIVRA